jgi:hypothetical protein
MFTAIVATILLRPVSDNTLTPAEQKAGFVLLFDGKTTTGWHGYKRSDMPSGWVAMDGTLSHKPDTEGGDISSDRMYGDFELRIDWRIAQHGNSGIMYRVTEDHQASYMTGPEFQVLDNAGHPDGKHAKTRAGTCYALYACSKEVARPGGEWNSARIIVKGNHVEHWLNGVEVVHYELHSAEWNKLVAGSKFAAALDFGTNPRGHIVLQDHGDEVSFKNIRIRELHQGAARVLTR